jgi:glycosyltransferase involved in cell wall biosynthesis
MATLLDPPSLPSTTGPRERPRARGKFLFAAGEKLYLKGVTYGTFRPNADRDEFPAPAVVERDFRLMAAHGVNAVRAYTAPPRWLLDRAWEHGLRVMVGLGVEREVGYLNDGPDLSAIEARMRARVRACAGHPAVLCYALGNEIPAPVVRWFGAPRIEGLLARLAGIVREQDPGALVTYVNYPSTEYLDCGFADLLSFNVYLESMERFDAYLPRLQNLAGDRPLLITELGLDSQRGGVERQAAMVAGQVRGAFARGAAGVFVYAWTDEWHRGGEDVHDWDFGLVRRDRSPKPALATVSRAFASVPFARDETFPRISVVVCTYNGSRLLRDCLEGITRLDYPDVEAIVVDDGSTDASGAIAAEYCVKVIRTENRGLSAARNTGWQAATGEIVAYIDDDARPDPHWLQYLAWAFRNPRVAGIGGPNIAPPGDGWIAECVANAPGGPMHVLLSDVEAEHIPGCNMAFRRAALEKVGGFDPQYRTAGDDVDLCWRVQDQVGPLGFHAGAMVWHHRRNSVRTYWRQQLGYGRAEALLERKWPERYNALGHYSWAGRIYGNGLTRALGARRGRIYQGLWGSAPFQSIYQRGPGLVASLPLMPEWHLGVVGLAALAALGALWRPLLLALPVLAVALAIPIAQAARSAAAADFTGPGRLKRRALTTLLHILQPIARLRGRLRHGLAPWRARGPRRAALPRPREHAVWTQRWRSAEARLRGIDASLRAAGVVVRHGGDYDRWDLEARGGLFASSRVLVGLEEQGHGQQMVRARTWPRVAPGGLVMVAALASLAAAAGLRAAPAAAGVLAAATLALGARIAWECALATGAMRDAVTRELTRDE